MTVIVFIVLLGLLFVGAFLIYVVYTATEFWLVEMKVNKKIKRGALNGNKINIINHEELERRSKE